MEAGAIYTCISFALGRRHVPVVTDGSLPSASWLLWEENHFKIREKRAEEEVRNSLCFHSAAPTHVEQTKQQPGDPVWGFGQICAVDEPVLSVGSNTMGISMRWEPHPEQGW